MKPGTPDLEEAASSYEGLQGDVRAWKLPELEVWKNEYSDRVYSVRVEIPEFNCICPKTGLPDFATISIEYEPRVRCVELKSLKLYIVAFRNLGVFHEHAVNRILDDFVRAVEPRSVQVQGVFGARGGITTTVEARWPQAGESSGKSSASRLGGGRL
jgi:7-cyano-7-deazaguanine reductase